jgi:serine/threonine protein kinase
MIRGANVAWFGREQISWSLVLRWLKEIVSGIGFLHEWSPPIVHRDLKTLNILLDADMAIKVCDFGLSRLIEDNKPQQTLFKLRGTYAYIGPEVYHGNSFTTKSDVYSLGIIMCVHHACLVRPATRMWLGFSPLECCACFRWELLQRLLLGRHTRPYSEYPDMKHDFQIIIQAATRDIRPTLPPSCPASVAALVTQCWAADPAQRPSCAELLVKIETLSTEYSQKRELWDRAVHH